MLAVSGTRKLRRAIAVVVERPAGTWQMLQESFAGDLLATRKNPIETGNPL
jgi:hypothetical protein